MKISKFSIIFATQLKNPSCTFQLLEVAFILISLINRTIFAESSIDMYMAVFWIFKKQDFNRLILKSCSRTQKCLIFEIRTSKSISYNVLRIFKQFFQNQNCSKITNISKFSITLNTQLKIFSCTFQLPEVTFGLFFQNRPLNNAIFWILRNSFPNRIILLRDLKNALFLESEFRNVYPTSFLEFLENFSKSKIVQKL